MTTQAKRLLLGASVLALLIGVVLLLRRDHAPAPTPAPSPVAGTRPAPRLAAPRPEESAQLEGTVRARGRPLAAVVVASRGEQLAAVARAGADGRFRLGPLATGQYRISAAAPGHLPAGRFVELSEPGPVRDFDLTLEPGGEEVSGRVVDASGGPIAGARVYTDFTVGGLGPRGGKRGVPLPAELPTGLAVTDEQGNYRLTLARGEHALRADADGYAPGLALFELAGPRTQDFQLIPGTFLAGWVARQGTGERLPGASVRAFARGAAEEAQTDAQGAFLIGPIEPGSYQLQATAGPLAGRLKAPVVATLAARVEGLTILVERALAVAGHVRRRGQPVVSAQVFLDGRAGNTHVPTDGRGAFRLEGLLPGRYQLSVMTQGQGAHQRPVILADRDLEGLEIELDRTAVVRGRVVDEHDRPCPEARVELDVENERDFEQVEGTVARQGRFSFENLPAGEIRVRGDGPCGRGRQAVGKVAAGEQKDVTLRLTTQGRWVRGTVRGRDGRPAPGIQIDGLNIRSDSDRTQASSGPDGRYQLGPYASGALVLVSPQTPALEPAGGKRSVRLDDGDVAGADFVIDRGGDLRGLVLGPEGRPLAGAVVRAAEGRAVSGPDGAFTFSGLPAGQFSVVADYPGLPRAVVPKVTAGRTDVRLQLHRAAVLAGTVEGMAGRGQGLCAVEARLPHEEASARAACGEGGAFELTGLPPGSYDLVATTVDGRSGGLPRLTLAEGQERRGLRVPLAGGVALTGRVVDLESRRPLAGARVQIAGEQSDVGTVSDGTGRFRVEGVPRALRGSCDVTLAGYLGNHHQLTVPMSGESFDVGDIPLLVERPGPPPTGRAGIVISRNEDGTFLVAETIEDLPAAKAGLRPGDLILAIDGHDLTNADLGTAVALIRGQPGTAITLDVRARDAKPRRLKFTRG